MEMIVLDLIQYFQWGLVRCKRKFIHWWYQATSSSKHFRELNPIKIIKKNYTGGAKIATWNSKLWTSRNHIYKYRLGNNQKKDLNSKMIRIKTQCITNGKFISRDIIISIVTTEWKILSLTIPQLEENFCPVWDTILWKIIN